MREQVVSKDYVFMQHIMGDDYNCYKRISLSRNETPYVSAMTARYSEGHA